MGQLIKDAVFNVGLVGVEDSIAKRLIERLKLSGAHDPGMFNVKQFTTLADCRQAVGKKSIQGICLAPETFTPDESTAFIGDIRVTEPLVSFCLVGRKAFLNGFPNYHESWKERFKHYYRLPSDLDEKDFDENAGLLRDLFVADSVKTRALGQYVTTPGAVIQIKSPRPYGFWLIIVASLLAALVGGAIGPVITRWLPPSSTPMNSSPTPMNASPTPIKAAQEK